jgi:hypothetical protein
MLGLLHQCFLDVSGFPATELSPTKPNITAPRGEGDGIIYGAILGNCTSSGSVFSTLQSFELFSQRCREDKYRTLFPKKPDIELFSQSWPLYLNYIMLGSNNYTTFNQYFEVLNCLSTVSGLGG